MKIHLLSRYVPPQTVCGRELYVTHMMGDYMIRGTKDHRVTTSLKAATCLMCIRHRKDKEGHTGIEPVCDKIICLNSHDQTGQGCICGHGDDTMPD